MGEILLPIAVFLLSNVLFGATIAAMLLRHGSGTTGSGLTTVVLGFGLAPYTISWVLNALLALFPGISQWAAIMIVCLCFLCMAFAARGGWSRLATLVALMPQRLREPAVGPYLFFCAAMVLGTGIMLLHKPLVDHDILEYGTQGQIFLRDMAVRYEKHHFDATTGFYYVGLHGFSFPLLFTWEGLLNGLVNAQGDAWVRVQTPWFAWLTVSFLWSWVRQYGGWLAVWVVGAFTLTLGFLYLNTIYHVDPVRLFLFTTSMALFIAVLRSPSNHAVVLWGVLLGAHALTHSLGMILAPFMLGAYFLASAEALAARFRHALVALLAFMVAGGFHYVLDISIGTGWLFKDITWF